MVISLTALVTITVIAFMLGMITAFVMMVNAIARMKSK
jgi:hypothetical protein